MMNGRIASQQQVIVSNLMPFRPFMNPSRSRYGSDPEPIVIGDFVYTRLEDPPKSRRGGVI